MTLTQTVPADILSGMPVPTRGRWQPQRAGITGLFHYDAQVFTFYRGRLLLRGNNGNGKSMALEVLLPFVLVADMDPSQLSTFGNRNRTLYTWLLGHDSTNRHTSARGCVWVEFARLGPFGRPEYFTVGALLEAVRAGEKVTPHYFTTAARIGIDLNIGTPGGETPTPDAFSTQLLQLTDRGLAGEVRTPRNHRIECNRVLFGLPDDSFKSLLKALRQLRRPKLSDKLSQKALAEILRESLPSLDRGLISGIAKGYERLDRHLDDIKNLRMTIAGLRNLEAAYKRYARAFLWQRAHAITACHQALTRAAKKARDSASERDRLAAAVDDCKRKVVALGTELKQLEGRLGGLRDTDFYIQGNDLRPLLDQAETLEKVAEQSGQRAKESASQARTDTDAASQAQDSADALSAAAQAQYLLVQHGAQQFTLLQNIFEGLRNHLEPGPSASELSLAEVRGRLRQAVMDLRGRVQNLNKMATRAAEATKAANALAKEVDDTRASLVEADEQAAQANEQLREARDEFATAARAWMARSDQLTGSGVPWVDVEPARMSSAMSQWRNTAHRTRGVQLNTLLQRFASPDGTQPQQAAAELQRGYRDLVDHARDAATARDAAHRDRAMARDEWLHQLTAWANSLTHLPVHAPAMPERAESAAPLWRDWINAAVRAHHSYISSAEQDLQERRRAHDVQQHQCQAQHGRLSDERETVAGQTAIAPHVPATRLDSRDGRLGAPLYMLIEFIEGGLDQSRMAGLEAGLIGSGLADAWVHPDGLLRTADGSPIADTLLAPATESTGNPLSTAIRADPDAANSAGVPVTTISAILADIELADTAANTTAALAVGWDGSWRTGPLHGAYRQSTATLVGAASRERARQARLAELDRQLADLDRQLANFAEHERELTSEATLLSAARDEASSEASALPPTSGIDYAERRFQDAEQADRDALARTSRRRQELHVALTDLHERRSDDLTTVAASQPIPGDYHMPALIEELAGSPNLALFDNYAHASEVMLHAIEQATNDIVRGLNAATDSTNRQYDEFPATDELVRHERQSAQAEQARTAARRRFADSNAKHQKAFAASAQEQAILEGALVEADLAAWTTQLNELPAKVDSWTDTAEDWLRAIGEHGSAAAALEKAAKRAADSAAAEFKAVAQAATDNDQAVAAREHYATLAERIGTGYTSVIAEIAEVQQLISDTEEELNNVRNNQIVVAAQHGSAETRAASDEEAHSLVAGDVPRQAAKLWAAVGADLPRAADWDLPATSDDGDPDAASAAAQKIHDLAGPNAANQFGSHHNDDLTSAVFDLRHHAEATLRARLTLIERYVADILVVEAVRDGVTATLPTTIADLNSEVISLQVTLNAEEAKLLEQFLTDSIRREVTDHIEGARKQIAAMCTVMKQHRTSAGYRFALEWIPAPGGDVDNRVLDLLGADFKVAPSAKERLREFFASRIAAIRATKTGQTWDDLLQEMLDYRRWYQFELQFSKGSNDFAELSHSEFDKLSGGEKSVALHLPLFAAAATHTISATVRDTLHPEKPGCPRFILLDEVFAGVDEDMRGELFDLVTSLDMDLVATSEAETGMYAELDGIAIYHLIKSNGMPGVLAARSIWTGDDVVHLLENDLELYQ